MPDLEERVAAPSAAEAAAADGSPGCTVARAGTGMCRRKPAPHEMVAVCSRCRTVGNQRACEGCLEPFAAGGRCGTCGEPLEITRGRADA